jgi:hypothetical protein
MYTAVPFLFNPPAKTTTKRKLIQLCAVLLHTENLEKETFSAGLGAAAEDAVGYL